jgi:7,8-dihydropterin-6-yl-methyl-4-(beta-D-ribofuranosyl)aminobenzene 5'-phosphate synthase
VALTSDVGVARDCVTSLARCSAPDKLHAVLGGFLGVAPPDYGEHTVAELKALAPDVVIPMHCTGRAFITKMRAEMPDQLIDWNTGSRFTFGV